MHNMQLIAIYLFFACRMDVFSLLLLVSAAIKLDPKDIPNFSHVFLTI